MAKAAANPTPDPLTKSTSLQEFGRAVRRGPWEYVPVEFKARSFREEAKEELLPWIISTYSRDDYKRPPPITTTGVCPAC